MHFQNLYRLLICISLLANVLFHVMCGIESAGVGYDNPSKDPFFFWTIY